MNALVAVFSARFRTLLQYRIAAVAGFGTQLFWGLIRLMIFEAFYRSSTAAQPMEPAAVATYIWLGQATFALLPGWIDAEILASIRTGNVAFEMLRPVPLYEMWYLRNLASRTAPLLLRAIPLFAVAIPFLGMEPPVSTAAALAWLAATILAVLLSAALATLMAASLLWTLSGEGVVHVVNILVWTCSGVLLPLPFYPDAIQPLLNALPFRGLMDVPFRIYTGHIPVYAALPQLASVAAWTAGIIAAGRLLMLRGTRRLVVQGG